MSARAIDWFLGAPGIEPADNITLAKKDRPYLIRLDSSDEPTPPGMEADLVWLWMAAAVLLLLMLLVGRRRTAVIIEHNPLDGSGGECYDARHMNEAIRFFSFYFYFASLLLPRSAEEDRLL